MNFVFTVMFVTAVCGSFFEYLVFCFLFSFLVHPLHFLQIGKKYLSDVMNHLFSLQNETHAQKVRE